jgi:hypothetical protein
MFVFSGNSQVAKSLGVPVAKQRFWVWLRRPNGTYRVSQVLEWMNEWMKQ